jgi:hypothetical protein
LSRGVAVSIPGRCAVATCVLFDKTENVIVSRGDVLLKRPVIIGYHPLDVRDVTLTGHCQKR